MQMDKKNKNPVDEMEVSEGNSFPANMIFEWHDCIERFCDLKSLLNTCNASAYYSQYIVEKTKQIFILMALELNKIEKVMSNDCSCKEKQTDEIKTVKWTQQEEECFSNLPYCNCGLKNVQENMPLKKDDKENFTEDRDILKLLNNSGTINNFIDPHNVIHQGMDYVGQSLDLIGEFKNLFSENKCQSKKRLSPLKRKTRINRSECGSFDGMKTCKNFSQSSENKMDVEKNEHELHDYVKNNNSSYSCNDHSTKRNGNNLDFDGRESCMSNHRSLKRSSNENDYTNGSDWTLFNNVSEERVMRGFKSIQKLFDLDCVVLDKQEISNSNISSQKNLFENTCDEKCKSSKNTSSLPTCNQVLTHVSGRVAPQCSLIGADVCGSLAQQLFGKVPQKTYDSVPPIIRSSLLKTGCLNSQDTATVSQSYSNSVFYEFSPSKTDFQTRKNTGVVNTNQGSLSAEENQREGKMKIIDADRNYVVLKYHDVSSKEPVYKIIHLNGGNSCESEINTFDFNTRSSCLQDKSIQIERNEPLYFKSTNKERECYLNKPTNKSIGKPSYAQSKERRIFRSPETQVSIYKGPSAIDECIQSSNFSDESRYVNGSQGNSKISQTTVGGINRMRKNYSNLSPYYSKNKSTSNVLKQNSKKRYLSEGQRKNELQQTMRRISLERRMAYMPNNLSRSKKMSGLRINQSDKGIQNSQIKTNMSGWSNDINMQMKSFLENTYPQKVLGDTSNFNSTSPLNFPQNPQTFYLHNPSVDVDSNVNKIDQNMSDSLVETYPNQMGNHLSPTSLHQIEQNRNYQVLEQPAGNGREYYANLNEIDHNIPDFNVDHLPQEINRIYANELSPTSLRQEEQKRNSQLSDHSAGNGRDYYTNLNKIDQNMSDTIVEHLHQDNNRIYANQSSPTSIRPVEQKRISQIVEQSAGTGRGYYENQPGYQTISTNINEQSMSPQPVEQLGQRDAEIYTNPYESRGTPDQRQQSPYTNPLEKLCQNNRGNYPNPCVIRGLCQTRQNSCANPLERLCQNYPTPCGIRVNATNFPQRDQIMVGDPNQVDNLSKESPYLSKESPYLSKESPYLSKESPYLSRESPYPTKESPYPTKESPYPTKESPYPTKESPYPTKESPYPTKESPYPTKESPYPTQESPYPTQESPYPTQESPYLSKESPYMSKGSPNLYKGSPILSKGTPTPILSKGTPTPILSKGTPTQSKGSPNLSRGLPYNQDSYQNYDGDSYPQYDPPMKSETPCNQSTPPCTTVEKKTNTIVCGIKPNKRTSLESDQGTYIKPASFSGNRLSYPEPYQGEPQVIVTDISNIPKDQMYITSDENKSNYQSDQKSMGYSPYRGRPIQQSPYGADQQIQIYREQNKMPRSDDQTILKIENLEISESFSNDQMVSGEQQIVMSGEQQILMPEEQPRVYEEQPRVYEEQPRVYEEQPRVYEEQPRVYEDQQIVMRDEPQIVEVCDTEQQIATDEDGQRVSVSPGSNKKLILVQKNINSKEVTPKLIPKAMSDESKQVIMSHGIVVRSVTTPRSLREKSGETKSVTLSQLADKSRESSKQPTGTNIDDKRDSLNYFAGVELDTEEKAENQGSKKSSKSKTKSPIKIVLGSISSSKSKKSSYEKSPGSVIDKTATDEMGRKRAVSHEEDSKASSPSFRKSEASEMSGDKKTLVNSKSPGSNKRSTSSTKGSEFVSPGESAVSNKQGTKKSTSVKPDSIKEQTSKSPEELRVTSLESAITEESIDSRLTVKSGRKAASKTSPKDETLPRKKPKLYSSSRSASLDSDETLPRKKPKLNCSPKSAKSNSDESTSDTASKFGSPDSDESLKNTRGRPRATRISDQKHGKTIQSPSKASTLSRTKPKKIGSSKSSVNSDETTSDTVSKSGSPDSEESIKDNVSKQRTALVSAKDKLKKQGKTESSLYKRACLIPNKSEYKKSHNPNSKHQLKFPKTNGFHAKTSSIGVHTSFSLQRQSSKLRSYFKSWDSSKPGSIVIDRRNHVAPKISKAMPLLKQALILDTIQNENIPLYQKKHTKDYMDRNAYLANKCTYGLGANFGSAKGFFRKLKKHLSLKRYSLEISNLGYLKNSVSNSGYSENGFSKNQSTRYTVEPCAKSHKNQTINMNYETQNNYLKLPSIVKRSTCHNTSGYWINNSKTDSKKVLYCNKKVPKGIQPTNPEVDNNDSIKKAANNTKSKGVSSWTSDSTNKPNPGINLAGKNVPNQKQLVHDDNKVIHNKDKLKTYQEIQEETEYTACNMYFYNSKTGPEILKELKIKEYSKIEGDNPTINSQSTQQLPHISNQKVEEDISNSLRVASINTESSESSTKIVRPKKELKYPFNIKENCPFQNIDNNRVKIKNDEVSKDTVQQFISILSQFAVTLDDQLNIMVLALNIFDYIKKKSAQNSKTYLKNPSINIEKQDAKDLYKKVFSVNKTVDQERNQKPSTSKQTNSLEKRPKNDLCVSKSTIQFIKNRLSFIGSGIDLKAFREIRGDIAASVALDSCELHQLLQDIDTGLFKITTVKEQIDGFLDELELKITLEDYLEILEQNIEKELNKNAGFSIKCGETEDLRTLVGTKKQLNEKLTELNDLLHEQVQEQIVLEMTRYKNEELFKQRLEYVAEVLGIEFIIVHASIFGNNSNSEIKSLIWNTLYKKKKV